MMPATAPSQRPRERKRSWRSFPARTLHLIDIENLAGSALPSLAQVQHLRALYRDRLHLGAADQVVLACNHRAFRTAGFGWIDSRHMVRSGRDGADLELLGVMHHENVAERFARVAIASGDGAFADEATRLADLGCQLIVISRREALSARLALAAHEVIYLDDAGQLRSAPGQSAQDEAALWRVLAGTARRGHQPLGWVCMAARPPLRTGSSCRSYPARSGGMPATAATRSGPWRRRRRSR